MKIVYKMHYGSFIAKVVTLLATLAYCQTLPAQPSGRSGFNEGWEFTLEGETKVLRDGDSVYIAPHQVHSAIAVEDSLLIDMFAPMREDFL